MAADGGLRKMFHANLRRAQWSTIETGPMCPGIPDSEFCFPGGIQGWLEYKVATGNKLKFQELQPSWIDRRVRLGGRVFIAVKRGKEMFLYHGKDVKKLFVDGLRGAAPLGQWNSPWNWAEVEELLCVGF